MSMRTDRRPGRLRIDVNERSDSTRQSLVLRFSVPPGLRAAVADHFPLGCVDMDAQGRPQIRVLLERDGDMCTWGGPPAPAAPAGRTFEHVVADLRLHETVRTRVATHLAATYWDKATPARVNAVLAAATAGEKRAAALRDDAGESAFAAWLRKRADDIYHRRTWPKVASIATPDAPVTGQRIHPRGRRQQQRQPVERKKPSA